MCTQRPFSRQWCPHPDEKPGSAPVNRSVTQEAFSSSAYMAYIVPPLLWSSRAHECVQVPSSCGKPKEQKPVDFPALVREDLTERRKWRPLAKYESKWFGPLRLGPVRGASWVPIRILCFISQTCPKSVYSSASIIMILDTQYEQIHPLSIAL